MDTQEIVESFRQEAMREGERTLLLRMLRRRFGAQVDGLIELRLMPAPIEQIEAWADRVLTAASLAEVFAD